MRFVADDEIKHHINRRDAFVTPSSPIPLLLSISPHFACTCLFHCLNYVFSFVFRSSWLQNFVFGTPWQSRLILNRTFSHSISVQLRNHIQFSVVSCSIHNSHKVLSVSVRSQPTFPPLSPELIFHRGRVIRLANDPTGIPAYNALTA